MQTMPTVSVVIPVFNRRNQVLAAVSSALAQTLPPMEIIVVDDGSTDGIEEIDFNSIDRRIRLIRQPENRGGAAARNAGMDAAEGDWIALLDSDDLWLPDKLEAQFAQIDKEPPGVPLIAASNVLVRRSGQPDRLYNRCPPPPGVRLCEYFLIHNSTFQTSTLLLQTRLAREMRFDSRLRRHQDWDFLLRLEQENVRFSYIHRPLAIYDNAPDPNRVSQAPDPEPTLAWYKIAGDRITPRAKHIHYMHTQFLNHLRRDKVAAVSTLIAFTLSYGLGPLHAAVHLLYFVGRVGKRSWRALGCHQA